jgi:hypothetical protein
MADPYFVFLMATSVKTGVPVNMRAKIAEFSRASFTLEGAMAKNALCVIANCFLVIVHLTREKQISGRGGSVASTTVDYC